jgi:hypothetical protein
MLTEMTGNGSFLYVIEALDPEGPITSGADLETLASNCVAEGITPTKKNLTTLSQEEPDKRVTWYPVTSDIIGDFLKIYRKTARE